MQMQYTTPRGVVGLRIAAVLALLLLAPFAIQAQTYYGTIRGTVTDASGAVSPGVEVTVTNLDTNISFKLKSNEVGNYLAPNLIPGRYSVTAEAAGFKKFVANDLELVATADRRVDVHMEVGAIAESVTVEGGAQVIETERATISDVKSNEVFTYMPINANYRSVWRMLQLSPGIVGSYFAGNGNGRNTTYSIDGIPVKDGWTGTAFGPALTYLDSYREIRADLVSVNATGGTSSNIAVVSESGTNELHGEAWIHYNAIGFQARNFFAPTSPHGPPIFRPNLKVGGPIWLPHLYNGKNRTFFHFSWQGLRGSQSPITTNMIVPSLAFRTGNFSSVTTVLKDPLNGLPFGGNQIPTTRISGVSKYFQDTFYPNPNTAIDRFGLVSVFPNNSDQYTGRVDHKINDKNSIFARIMYQYYDNQYYDGGSNPNVGLYDQWRLQWHGVLSDTHIFSPTLLNEFRMGYARDESPYGGLLHGLDTVNKSGLQLDGLSDIRGLPSMCITGFSGISTSGMNGWMWSTFHYQEVLHWTRGKHDFRFGAEISKYNGKTYGTSPSAVFGSYSFDGHFSGNPYADFLLGIPTGSSRSTSVGSVYPHRFNKEFYVTDDFKVTPHLTLTLGLRYSLLDPGIVEQNLLANFVPAVGAIVVPDAAAKARINPGFPKTVPIVTADQAGLSNKLLNRDKNNFAPRFGFAWRPTQNNDFVVRGGAGIYYVAMQPYISDGGGLPYELAESFTNNIVNGVPDFAFPKPFPARGFVGASGGYSATGMNPDLRTPYSMQFNLTAEKQVKDTGISLSAVSTRSRKTTWGYNLNAVPANTTPYATKYAYVPYPSLFGITETINGGSHNYQAGTVKVEHRMKNGIYLQSHFTLSKDMGDDWSNSSEDAFNRARDRSQGGVIPRLRWVSIMLYELPVGKSKAFGKTLPKPLMAVLGNWSVDGTYIAQSGMYFTPAFASIDSSNTNRRGGRPDRIADGNLSTDQRSATHWFDTSAFVAPAAGIGRFGTSGANILEGPGISVFHAGINKDFVVRERVKIKLEAVSTNFLNHPNFALPSATIGTSTYGQILGLSGGASSSSGEGARDFQFTMRVTF